MPEVQAPASFAHLHAEDVAGIRSAAQLIMGCAGGLVVLIFAGFQFSSLSSGLAGPWWRVSLTAVTGLIALGLALFVMRRAGAVLVPDRMLVHDLLAATSKDVIGSSGGSVVSPGPLGATGRPASRVDNLVLDRLDQAKGWLLPPGHKSLNDVYDTYRKADDPDERDRMRRHLIEVVSYARAEAARIRYAALVKTLTGWCGVVAAFALVGFVALAS